MANWIDPRNFGAVGNTWILQNYPGTPQLKSILPKCGHCPEKDVKPGEDLCWECLGEYYPTEGDLTYWVYGSNSVLLDSASVYPPTYEPIVFTWNAPVASSVTGLTVTGPLGTYSKSFAAIYVNNGDSIQFTLTGCTIV